MARSPEIGLWTQFGQFCRVTLAQPSRPEHVAWREEAVRPRGWARQSHAPCACPRRAPCLQSLLLWNFLVTHDKCFNSGSRTGGGALIGWFLLSDGRRQEEGVGERNSSPDRHKISLMRQITTPLGQAQPNQVRPVRERHEVKTIQFCWVHLRRGSFCFTKIPKSLGLPWQGQPA